MNPNVPPLLLRLKDILTEVPGWPDAPWPHRLVRLTPVLVPYLLLSAMAAAVWLHLLPEHARAQAVAQPLLDLETHVSSLSLRYSQAEVERLREEFRATTAQRLASESERQELLTLLTQRSRESGWQWQGAFAERPSGTGTSAGQDFVLLRGTLRPARDNAKPLASLVALLEEFTQLPKRLELTRVTVRADEQGWQGVEVLFHAAITSPHEKVAQ